MLLVWDSGPPGARHAQHAHNCYCCSCRTCQPGRQWMVKKHRTCAKHNARQSHLRQCSVLPAVDEHVWLQGMCVTHTHSAVQGHAGVDPRHPYMQLWMLERQYKKECHMQYHSITDSSTKGSTASSTTCGATRSMRERLPEQAHPFRGCQTPCWGGRNVM